jgi:hypothetical protein
MDRDEVFDVRATSVYLLYAGKDAFPSKHITDLEFNRLIEFIEDLFHFFLILAILLFSVRVYIDKILEICISDRRGQIFLQVDLIIYIPQHLLFDPRHSLPLTLILQFHTRLESIPIIFQTDLL